MRAPLRVPPAHRARTPRRNGEWQAPILPEEGLARRHSRPRARSARSARPSLRAHPAAEVSYGALPRRAELACQSAVRSRAQGPGDGRAAPALQGGQDRRRRRDRAAARASTKALGLAASSRVRDRRHDLPPLRWCYAVARGRDQARRDRETSCQAWPGAETAAEAAAERPAPPRVPPGLSPWHEPEVSFKDGPPPPTARSGPRSVRSPRFCASLASVRPPTRPRPFWPTPSDPKTRPASAPGVRVQVAFGLLSRLEIPTRRPSVRVSAFATRTISRSFANKSSCP